VPYVYFGSLFFQPLKVQTQGMSDNEKSELLIYNSCLRDMSVIFTYLSLNVYLSLYITALLYDNLYQQFT